jgi:hypothetical protein
LSSLHNLLLQAQAHDALVVKPLDFCGKLECLSLLPKFNISESALEMIVVLFEQSTALHIGEVLYARKLQP